MEFSNPTQNYFSALKCIVGMDILNNNFFTWGRRDVMVRRAIAGHWKHLYTGSNTVVLEQGQPWHHEGAEGSGGVDSH